MTCDKNYSLSQLFNMALRPDDAGNLIVDTIETDVEDACIPFDDCGLPHQSLDMLLKGLFEERQANCWAVRIASSSENHCDYYFTCDNNDESIESALRKSIVKGLDGKPVLSIAESGDLVSYTCDENLPFMSLIKSLFWANSECVKVRVGNGGGNFDPCAIFTCNTIPGGWKTALLRAIGKTDNNCPAFFFNIGAGPVDDCNIPDLLAGLFECATPYFLVADPTSDVNIGAIHFLWEQSTDNSTWTFVAEGDGLTSAQFLEFTNPQFMRVTMSCGEYSLTRTMDIGFAFASQSWSMFHWLNYALNGGNQQTLNPTDVFWLAEGESMDIINNNAAMLGSTYTSNNFHAGPNRTNLTKSTVDDQTLYEEVGTITITDNLTFPGNGCVITFPYEVHFVPIPIVSAPTNFLCPGNNVTLTADYGANTSELYTTYQWYKDDVIIGGANSKTYDADAGGVYKCVCDHHGKTVTSNNFTVTVQTDVPQPSIVFEKLNPANNEYIINPAGNKVYVPSDTATCKVTVVDTGAYSGGYPAGTTFEFIGLTPAQLNNYYDLINSTVLVKVIVILPLALGACSAQSADFTIDFTEMQAAQIGGEVERPCSAGSPVPPDDGTYWGMISEDCAGAGTSLWGVIGISSELWLYSLDTSTPGQVTINCPMLADDPNTDLDMSANIQWFKLYDLASDTWGSTLVQSGGTSLVVTEPGVYGVVSTGGVYPALSNVFGYINFIVPIIP